MSTLDRYILNIFTRNLLLVLATLVTLYGLIEFLEKVDDFIEHEAALRLYILYPLYNLPVELNHTLPMAILLATFATIGGLSRSSQITAMLSSGISFIRISRPLFLAGLLLSGLVIVGNLWIVPWSSREVDYIREIELPGRQPREVTGSNIYFRDGNRIVSINNAFPEKNLILGLNIVEFNDDFMPVKRIQASRASHTDGGMWQLKNVIVWGFSPETRTISDYKQYKSLEFDLKRQPSDLVQLRDNPEDLSVSELMRLSTKLQEEGHDPKAYQVETQLRFAKAAIPLIMVLIGFPFALQRGRNASFSFGIVASLVIFAVYFILNAIFAVFGAVAILPPLLAAWAANILLALVGCWFFLKIQG